MVVKHAFLLFLVFLIFPLGCKNIAEYDMAFQAGLLMISPEDFSVTGIVPGIEGGRCLLINDNDLFVVSTEGTIVRYTADDLELVDENTIAAPSPAGFSDAVISTVNGTAYIIGAMGTILEVSMQDCTVIDEFSVCQSPVMLALGNESENLFVADGPSSRIYQVGIVNNTAHDNVPLYFNINDMEPFQNPDSMLVATSGRIFLISVLSPSDICCRMIAKGCSGFRKFSLTREDLSFVAIKDHTLGVFGYNGLAFEFSPIATIGGDSHLLEIDPDREYAYVLSYTGENTSRFSVYNYVLHTFEMKVDIPGYPLDLEISGAGNIYLLTAD
jgi:hypothetical protein